MKAVALHAFGGPEVLVPTDLPRPKAERGELLIRALAVGVNPVDWKVREGQLAPRVPHGFPLIPGWDVAGVVDELGEGCQRFRKGDRVFAFARKPHIQWGTYAEYVAVPERHVALMPASLLFEEAAAIPCAALTAQQALARAGLSAEVQTRWYVNSEGTLLQTSRPSYRIVITASTKAADGMDLPRYETFFAFRPQDLPSDEVVLAPAGGTRRACLRFPLRRISLSLFRLCAARSG
jgi:hypothetical protein